MEKSNSGGLVESFLWPLASKFMTTKLILAMWMMSLICKRQTNEELDSVNANHAFAAGFVAIYLVIGVRYDLENGSGTMEIISRIQKEIHRRSIQGVAAEIFELGVRHWRRRCQIEKRHEPVVETNAFVIKCGQRLWYSIIFGKTSQCLLERGAGRCIFD